MFYIISIVLLSFSSLSISAAASATAGDSSAAHAPTTYKGQKITSENLHMLGTPLPQHVTDQLKDTHPVLVSLCANPALPLKPAALTDDSIVNGYEDYPSSAYFLLHISGFCNRLQSMLITKDVWPGQWGCTRDGQLVVQQNGRTKPLALVLPKLIPTYQTASQFRNFLLCNELIEQHNLRLVRATEIYIHLLDQAKAPYDENCIILKKQVSAPWLERNNLATDLTEDHIKELFILVEGLGIWQLIKGEHDLAKPLVGDWRVGDILRDEKGVLHLHNLEQPNNSNPDYFFDRNDTEHHGNIKSGIEQLAVMCAHDPKKVALLTELVSASKKINAAGFSPRFKSEINLVLTQVSSHR